MKALNWCLISGACGLKNEHSLTPSLKSTKWWDWGRARNICWDTTVLWVLINWGRHFWLSVRSKIPDSVTMKMALSAFSKSMQVSVCPCGSQKAMFFLHLHFIIIIIRDGGLSVSLAFTNLASLADQAASGSSSPILYWLNHLPPIVLLSTG